MNPTTLIANLRHAARNRETVTIGGGEFDPAEMLAAADAFDAMLAALQYLSALHPRRCLLAEVTRARAAIVKATGGEE